MDITLNVTFVPAARESDPFLPGEMVTGIYLADGDSPGEQVLVVVPDDSDGVYFETEDGTLWTGPFAYDSSEWYGWTFLMGGPGTSVSLEI